MVRFDIVHAGDPRYLGGTSSALRAELKAGVRAGYRIAFLPYLGPRSGSVTGMEIRVEETIRELGIPILTAEDPVEADILFAHHPMVFERLPDRPVALRPGHVVAVLHHPIFDGRGVPQYNVQRLTNSLSLTFSAPVSLAPISPVVRGQLHATADNSLSVLTMDLPNLIDLAEWPLRDRPPPRDKAVIGRHSRDDPLKWPDDRATLLAAYPANDLLKVRILGGSPFGSEEPLPPGWTVLPFGSTGISEFLRGLDFFVFFHSSKWIEAFGIAVAEAMATGLVALVPPSFRETFGEAAIYCRPHEVADTVKFFVARPDEYQRQSRAARNWTASTLGLEGYRERIDALALSLDRTIRASDGVSETLPARTRKRVIFVAGNGIGLGHVTRLLAIARALPDDIEPIFLTLSLATPLLREQGVSADYVLAHGRAGVTGESWNAAFAMELDAAINASGARMVVFDGNDAFPGMHHLLAARPDIARVWVRRGLWQPQSSLNLETEALFDMILEPWELAAFEDVGATADRTKVERIGPILLALPEDRLSRNEAAATLDIDPKDWCVAVQLGAEANTDMSPVREALASLPDQHGGRRLRTIEILNPIAPARSINSFETRVLYPVAPVSRAFDVMVTTAGYNGFHECSLGGVPTIYVPNESPEMDDQSLRAAAAETAGLARSVPLRDTAHLQGTVLSMLNETLAKEIASRAAKLPKATGAKEAADRIALFLQSVRTDRDLGTTLPRCSRPDI